MVEIKVSKDSKDILEYANAAIKHCLYINGWSIFRILKNVVQENGVVNPPTIALAYTCDNIPVGICILRAGKLDTFVRKSFRKKGIGKALVNSLVKPQDNPPRVFRGIKGSDIFYRKCFRKENGTHVMWNSGVYSEFSAAVNITTTL